MVQENSATYYTTKRMIRILLLKGRFFAKKYPNMQALGGGEGLRQGRALREGEAKHDVDSLLFEMGSLLLEEGAHLLALFYILPFLCFFLPFTQRGEREAQHELEQEGGEREAGDRGK